MKNALRLILLASLTSGCSGSDTDTDTESDTDTDTDITGTRLEDQSLIEGAGGGLVGYLCEVNQGLGSIDWRIDGTSSLCSGRIVAYLEYDDGTMSGSVFGRAGSFVITASDVGTFSDSLPEGFVVDIPVDSEATIDGTPEGIVVTQQIKVTFRTDATVDVETIVNPM